MTEEIPDRVIRGRACGFHSKHYGVPVYRAYDIATGHPRAQYFGLTDDHVIEAFTLDAIKHAIGQHRNGVKVTYGDVWDRSFEDGALLKFCTRVKG